MFSDRQLANFERYLRVIPKAEWGNVPASGPLGAYDSATGRHGRLHMGYFSRGGAFDEIGSGGGDVSKALRFLASKLSMEDWAELRDVLCGEGEEDGASDDPALFKGMPRGSAMDRALRPRRITPEMSAAYDSRFPDAIRIKRLG